MSMASGSVMAELANRMNNKGQESSDAPMLPAEDRTTKMKSESKAKPEKQGFKKIKRSKSHDPDKSPNEGKKKGKTKAQRVDSDSGGETESKKTGFFSNLKKAFKKRPAGKERKRSADENLLKSKSRSESDLIGADKGTSNLVSVDAGSRNSWGSGLDDAGLDDDDAKGKKSGISAFFDKKIRDSFRNRFKIKTRKSSLEKKSGSNDKRPSGFSSQRPLSDSNLYKIGRDDNFFDDSFFTVSLTNDNESFLSQPESIAVGDFSALDTSEGSVENDLAKSKIQAAPKNRRKPTRFRGSKSMSDTTDNMASTSSLGMISEVTSDEDGKLSPVSKDEDRTEIETSSGREERPAEDTDTLNFNGPHSSSGSSFNDLPKGTETQRSNSPLVGQNGPAGELSRVLTSSLSSLEKPRLNSRASADRVNSKSSLEKSESKSSLNEFEIKRLSLRSASSRELSRKASDSDGSRSDLNKKESPTSSLPNQESSKPEVPKKPVSPKLGIAKPLTTQSDPIKASPHGSLPKRESPIPEHIEAELSHASAADERLRPDAEATSSMNDLSLDITTGLPRSEDGDVSTADIGKAVSFDRVKKESKIPVHAKTQPFKVLDDPSVLLSNDVNDETTTKGLVEDKTKTALKSETKLIDIDGKCNRLPEPGFNVDLRSQTNARPDPSPRSKGSGLPVLDRTKRIPNNTPPSDEPGETRDRSKSTGSRLTTQPYRFGNKALSLDDDFRSNDDKSVINRSKSLNYDSKKLRFANKALSGKPNEEVVKNGVSPDEEKPNWVSIAREKQEKRSSMDLTESSAEEQENGNTSYTAPVKLSPTTENKPEIPKKPKGLKLPSSAGDVGSQQKEKDIVRTPRNLKIQSSAAPVVDIPQDANISAANCVVCGKISYMFGRFELDGQYIHKSCAKCSVCGTVVTASSLSLKENTIFCEAHA